VSPSIGDAVILTNAHPVRVGHVVGTRQVSGLALFDVAFERECAYSLLEEEIAPATCEQVRAMLAGLAFEAEASRGEEAPLTPAGLRDQIPAHESQARFAESLRRLMATSTDTSLEAAGARGLGDTVAVRKEDGWYLALVRGIVSSAEGTLFDLVVEGELERHPKTCVTALTDPNLPKAHVSLGSRARLASEAEAADDAFTGTVCRIEATDIGLELALAFDDGDVFLGLTPHDLVAVDDG